MDYPSVQTSLLLNNSDNISVSPVGQTIYAILSLFLNRSFHCSVSFSWYRFSTDMIKGKHSRAILIHGTPLVKLVGRNSFPFFKFCDS